MARGVDDTLAWMNELTAEMEERRKAVHKGGVRRGSTSSAKRAR